LIEIVIDTEVVGIAIRVGRGSVGGVVSFQASLSQDTRCVQAVAGLEIIREWHF